MEQVKKRTLIIIENLTLLHGSKMITWPTGCRLNLQESMTKICPPPNDDYVGNATFSCAADGYW